VFSDLVISGYLIAYLLVQALPGVVQYIAASDIPEGGENNAFARYTVWPLPKQEVFTSGKIEFAGQAIGMILAGQFSSRSVHN
jgi:xanthine dehydrogenase molybdopterin-binding subunit B